MSKDNQKVTGDSIYRVKMYKDGKRWVYAGATTLALAAGLVFANVNASADTTPANATKTEQVTSGASSSATSQLATSDASSASSTSQSTSTASAATQSATSTSTASPVASQNNTTQTAVATSAKVQSRAAGVDTTATVQQETPTVTAPTSSATPKVTSEATLTTSEAASGSTSEATSTVATGNGSLAASHDINANNVKVDGTTVAKTVKGQKYDMQVVLTKNPKIDWNTGRTNGQFSIAPAGSSETANGTWKAVSYQIDENTPVTVGTGSTIVVPVKDVINATTLTFNYEYTATNDTNSNSDYLSINDIPNADDKAHIEAAGNTDLYQNGWDYTAQTTTDVTTTTPAEDAQDVSVAYVVITGVNADGTPKYTQIAGGVTKSGKVGTTFTISPATIDGYALYGASDNVKPGDNGLTGTVDSVATKNEIVLVYAENTGIVANYQTADGTTLAKSNQYTQGTDKTFTRAGGTYKLTAPSLDGYTYVGYKIGDGDVQSGNVAAGTLVAGANTVTFIYAPVVEQSDVTVNYVDESGNTIKAATTQTLDNGSTYTVETPTIDGYTYKSADAALTGTVDGNKTITLTYTKNAAPVEQSTVTVNYVDADGNTIKAATTQTLDNGSTYTVETPTIDGYTYKSADAALTGTVDGNKTITLTYTKNATPVEQSTVTVNYVDADGNTIKAATTQTLDNGSTYTVETPTIDGYTYKSADAALTGTVDGNKTITLTYTKNSTTPVENKANLTINYVDADGNTIKASSVTEYIVGQAYTVGQPEIAGYTYDHATGDAIAGTIAYNGNTVTLVYTKNGGTTPTEQTKTITVNYVDADGNTIKSATTTTYKVGDTYTVATPSIDGYTYKSADGDLSGTVADDATITLTYAKTDNGGSTTAPTTAPGTGDNGNNGGGTITTAPTTAPGTGDNINGGGTGTTTTAPVTTPSDDTVDNGNGSSNNGGSSTTTTSTAPATTVSDDEVTPTTTAATNNGTSGVVPASASLKPVVTTKTTTSDAKTLPQTDEDENGTALAVLGLSTLLMGSALYFGVSRRKHEA
ncbi:Internalin-J [Lactiplantibacillus plantarum]|uniref:LPXTG cell wall anchor domain-containing protein n=5 Tax=Lactiplantibacillus argentoratensis TaxID=271881 RepID=A0AAN1Q1N1_9LACO|nr:MucBP domain-containing protein [Lactiplantibacillus argentoratensis]MPQ37121.1 LPXTG cell wall anchor domain-containing protein [Lactiplantibacillus plantarum]AYJ36203.1 LPXTG cell wall anchor domain-containing protein [Lactiplantibacillus argentoratensis]KRL90028.1 gy family cell surface protein [Lactiplantibacillus argentoratensis DSM 16365]MBT1144120.1 MucBP domain-containing protein [Lactiplantibacillus argentoratensis]MBT1146982.1 MucBP domain-containing protein [Lactiplantibacillus a